MRAFLLLSVIAGLPALCQNSSPSAPPPPMVPRAMFDAAAPFYRFDDASQHPWHLRAKYQLYDESGNPTESGAFEYWWEAPGVHRTTWNRGGKSLSEWDTADSRHAQLSTELSLMFMEYGFQTALLSPLPESEDLDPGKTLLEISAGCKVSANFGKGGAASGSRTGRVGSQSTRGIRAHRQHGCVGDCGCNPVV